MSEKGENISSLVNETLSGEAQLHIDQKYHDATRLMQMIKEECFENHKDEMNTRIEGFCSPEWDKVLCWPKAPIGQMFFQPCPEFIPFFNKSNYASRFCTDEGSWFTHPDTNVSWSNYSSCVNPTDILISPPYIHSEIKEWLPIIKKISQIGYAVSFIILIFALFILLSIKKLRCPRNNLHIHLFISFMMRAGISLLKDLLFVNGLGLPNSVLEDDAEGLVFNHNQSNWECKIVTSLWQYFIVANYTWILMEGLYLHNLIFLAPFSDSSAITLYIILGWGCPLLVVGFWIFARFEFDDTYCWTTHTNRDWFLIIQIPIIFSIVLNFFFFLNIVRVLLSKLSSAVSIETRKYRYRKWAKSTLLLVPLFGVHYMIFIGMSYFVNKNPTIETVWLFCDQLFASFQGFFVSILYCLINGEVRSELSKIWHGWRYSDGDAKNIWVPLNQISSKFYHRSTHEEDLVTNGVSLDVAGGLGASGPIGNLSTEVLLSRTPMDKPPGQRKNRDLTNEMSESCLEVEDVLIPSPPMKTQILRSTKKPPDDQY